MPPAWPEVADSHRTKLLPSRSNHGRTKLGADHCRVKFSVGLLRHAERMSPCLTKSLERASKKVFHVALDFRGRRSPSGARQGGILVRQHARKNFPEVGPLVNELLEHAGIRMLRRTA